MRADPRSRGRRSIIAAALAVGVLVLAPILGGGEGAGRDRIVYASTRDGGMEIYVVDPDDGETLRLTHNDGFDGLPDWSPDGTRIAFTSDMDGTLDEQEPGGPSDLELYTMAADGSEVVRLTHNSRYEGETDWSPDGSRLAFDAADPFEDLQVYVMDSDGRGQTTALTSGAPNGHPSWSPDGSKIAFTSLRDGDRDLRHGARRQRADEPHEQPRLRRQPAGMVSRRVKDRVLLGAGRQPGDLRDDCRGVQPPSGSPTRPPTTSIRAGRPTVRASSSPRARVLTRTCT